MTARNPYWVGMTMALAQYPLVQRLARIAQKRLERETQREGLRKSTLAGREGVLEDGLRQVMETVAGQQSVSIGRDLERLRRQWGRGSLFGHVEQGSRPRPIKPRSASASPVGERTSDGNVTFLLRVDLEGELNTGLHVREGQHLSLSVEGNCRLSPTLLTNAGGIEIKEREGIHGNPIMRSDATYPDFPCGTVVALIGGWTCSVRGCWEGTVGTSGVLRLAINDVVGWYRDNRAPGGEIVVMAVTVKVEG